jgi:hypothetical protein
MPWALVASHSQSSRRREWIMIGAPDALESRFVAGSLRSMLTSDATTMVDMKRRSSLEAREPFGDPGNEGLRSRRR